MSRHRARLREVLAQLKSWPPACRAESDSVGDVMRIIDVSLPIGPDLLAWPGDPKVSVEPAARVERGDDANVSELRMSTHAGTHIDPPAHLQDVDSTVDRIPIEVLIGPADVVDLRSLVTPVVGRDALVESLPAGTERVLFKTRNSDLWDESRSRWPDRYVALSADAARWLVDAGIRLVGTDFLSIEAADAPGLPVHRTLLSAGIVILEGLDLRAVAAGEYTLACLPLKIAGGDGAPARAVLIEAGPSEGRRPTRANPIAWG